MDENEANEAQRTSSLKRRRLVSDYRAVFSSDAGMRVLADLFQKCILEQVGVMQNETAVHQLGRSFEFARIYKMMRTSEEEFLRYMEESE